MSLERKELVLLISKVTGPSNSKLIKYLPSILRRIKKDCNEIDVFLKHKSFFETLQDALSKPNSEGTINFLSLLDICCCKTSFCNELINYKIVSSLVFILQNINDNKLLSYTCKVIGKLAKANAPQLNVQLNESKAVCFVTKVLIGTSCRSTQNFALYAVGWLWSVCNMRDIQRSDSIKYVVNFLVSDDTSKYKPCLIALSRLKLSPRRLCVECALQVNENKGFEKLVSLLPTYPDLVGAVLSTLMKTSATEVYKRLSESEMLSAVFDQLKIHPNNSILIRTLYLACKDYSLQISLRISNFLPFFLSLFKNFSYKSREMMCLLMTLKSFERNPYCLQEMVNNDLVNILSVILNDIVQNEKLGGLAHERTFQPISDEQLRKINHDSTFFEEESDGMYVDNVWNLIDSILTVFLAIAQQGSHSQTAVIALLSEEVWISFLNCIRFVPLTISEKATKILSHLGRLPKYFMTIYRNRLIIHLERSLLRTVHSDCFHCAYLYHAGTVILKNISKAAECGMVFGELTHILNQGDDKNKRELAIVVALAIRDEKQLQKYLYHHNCLDLIFEAIDDPTLSEDAFVCLSFMSKFMELNENIKLKLEVDSVDGDERDCFLHETKDAFVIHTYPVNILSNNITIHLTELKSEPSSCERHSHDRLIDLKSVSVGSVERTIVTIPELQKGNIEGSEAETLSTFSFNDNNEVTVDRDLLIRHSPMFEGMFRESNFRESAQDKILLQNISSKCFVYLIRLLNHFCYHHMPRDISILLELIIVADQYLIAEMPRKLLPYLMHAISFENASTVFSWAVEHGAIIFNNKEISNFVILYLLTAYQKFQYAFTKTVAFEKQRGALEEILNGKYCDQFLFDIKEMIHFVLSKQIEQQSRYSR